MLLLLRLKMNFTSLYVQIDLNLKGHIGEIPVALAVALSTTMAQRLLLNIRENFERRQKGGADADENDPSGDEELGTEAQSDTLAFSDQSLLEMTSVSPSGRDLEGLEMTSVQKIASKLSGRNWKGKGKVTHHDGHLGFLGEGRELPDAEAEAEAQSPVTATMLSGTKIVSRLSPISPLGGFVGHTRAPCSLDVETPTAGPSRLSHEAEVNTTPIPKPVLAPPESKHEPISTEKELPRETAYHSDGHCLFSRTEGSISDSDLTSDDRTQNTVYFTDEGDGE